jgi:hypothetical protein
MSLIGSVAHRVRPHCHAKVWKNQGESMRDQLNDMQLYLVDEFVEDYEEGLLSRRDAL